MHKYLYSFLVLLAMSAAMSVIAVAISYHAINTNDQKFCDVIHIVIAVPVPSPSNPKANPSREVNYENYAKFVTLGRNLGCGK